jgi:hypothetical protein
MQSSNQSNNAIYFLFTLVRDGKVVTVDPKIALKQTMIDSDNQDRTLVYGHPAAKKSSVPCIIMQNTATNDFCYHDISDGNVINHLGTKIEASVEADQMIELKKEKFYEAINFLQPTGVLISDKKEVIFCTKLKETIAESVKLFVEENPDLSAEEMATKFLEELHFKLYINQQSVENFLQPSLYTSFGVFVKASSLIKDAYGNEIKSCYKKEKHKTKPSFVSLVETALPSVKPSNNLE